MGESVKMRKKIITIVFLMAIMLCINVGKVRAYKLVNSFKKGDVITAIASCKEEDGQEIKCETQKFTVVKDNTTGIKYYEWGLKLELIYAVYNGHVGEPVEFSKINDTLKKLEEQEKDAPYSNTGKLLKIDDIVNNFDGKETEIKNSTWAKSDFPYWVEDSNGGKYYVEGSKIKVADENTKAYIRPIIGHTAFSVKDGMAKPSSWKEFNEMLKIIINERDKDMVYEYDDASLILKKDESYIKYSFDGTTLKFDSKNKSDFTSIIPEDIFVLLAYELYTNPGKLRIESDKIIGDYFRWDTEKDGDFSVNLKHYYGWEKNSIINNDATQISEIKNPKTGDKKLDFVICISVLLTGVLIYSVRKLKKLN